MIGGGGDARWRCRASSLSRARLQQWTPPTGSRPFRREEEGRGFPPPLLSLPPSLHRPLPSGPPPPPPAPTRRRTRPSRAFPAPAREIQKKKFRRRKRDGVRGADAPEPRAPPEPASPRGVSSLEQYPEEADGEEFGVEEVPVADHLGHAGPALLHRVPRGPRPGPQRRTRPSRTFRAGLGNSSEEERQTEQFQQASSSSTPARHGGRGAARGRGRGGARGRGAGRARGRRPPGAAPRRRRARPAPRAREGGVAAPVPDRHHQPGPRRGPGPALRGGPAPSARGPRPPRHGPGAGELAVPTPTRWLLRPASRAHRARPRPR